MRKLLGELTRRAPELKRSLINQKVDDAGLNALVLVNGREISVLGGLDAMVKDGDVVVFVPVVHGG